MKLYVKCIYVYLGVGVCSRLGTVAELHYLSLMTNFFLARHQREDSLQFFVTYRSQKQHPTSQLIRQLGKTNSGRHQISIDLILKLLPQRVPDKNMPLYSLVLPPLRILVSMSHCTSISCHNPKLLQFSSIPRLDGILIKVFCV